MRSENQKTKRKTLDGYSIFFKLNVQFELFRCWIFILFLIFSFSPLFSNALTSDQTNCPKLIFTSNQCCISPGSIITFNWKGGCPSDQINISLVNETTLVPTFNVATGTSNTGFFTWTVPTGIQLDNYLMYIEDTSNSNWDYGAVVTIAKDCFESECNCKPDFEFKFKKDGCSIAFNLKQSEICKIENVLWSFGDNETSTDIYPTHTYSDNGTYAVCLTVTYTNLMTKETCTEKICKPVIIETCLDCCPITPVFNYQIEKCLVRFEVLNRYNECSKIIKWNWDFGDGSSVSNLPTPSHNYTQDGTYKVCLTATIETTDGLIFQTIICRTLLIEDCDDNKECCPIAAKFNYKTVYPEFCNIKFDGFSLPNNCPEEPNWFWDFGDGNSSTLQNPVHIYSADGSYQVCLKVQVGNPAAKFCEDIYCEKIQISNCIRDTTGCNLSGQILSQSDVTCNRDLGGSVVVQGSNGTAPYLYTLNGLTQSSGSFSNLSPGSYGIFITDATNCSVTLSVTINSEPFLPVVVAGNGSICLGGSANLLATPNGTFHWSPSMGLSCTTCPNPIASPSVTTTYTVDHIDLNGCKSSSQVTVTVGETFEFDIPDQVICPGDAVFLNPNSISGAYLWQPSSGLSCTNCPNPEATLNQETTYSVTIIDGNCIGTDSVTVFMHPSAAIDFTCYSQDSIAVIFNAVPSNLNSYSWNFGDPDSGPNNTALGAQVSHIFSTPNQNYTICLTAEDECGPFQICRPVFIEVDCANLLKLKKTN